MPLVAGSMASAMIAAVQNLTDPQAALIALGNAIADYVRNNALVNFAWVAQLPIAPFTPDPVTVATGKITVLNVTLTKSMATTQQAALNSIKQDLVNAMMAAQYNITTAGFTTAPGAMSSAPTINSLVITISGNTQLAGMTALANSIINWIKGLIPTAPCAGSHGSYVGAGTVVNIL